MSRKRDTNWREDEITVLLDGIEEITKKRADDGKRTNSKEVFEYAAKKMEEKGHKSRAEREKCRTKWKKMKEEYTQAKRAREGDTRYKEAPGIKPFFDRLDEFIKGNYDNISPHSTIVRRTSSLSSGRPSSGGSGFTTNSAGSSTGCSVSSNSATSTVSNTTNVNGNGPTGNGCGAMRTSARIAANTSSDGASSNNNMNTMIIDNTNINNNNNVTTDQSGDSTLVSHTKNDGEFSSNADSLTGALPQRNQSRLSSLNTTTTNTNSNSPANNNDDAGGANNLPPSTIACSSPVAVISSATSHNNNINNNKQNHNQHHQIQNQNSHNNHHHNNNNNHQQCQHHQNHQPIPYSQSQPIPRSDMCTHSTAYNHNHNHNHNNNNNFGGGHNNHNTSTSSNMSSSHTNHNDSLHVPSHHDHADISYRVSSGCRQITIFGDHDVDIKFRGDCITINKIDVDHSSAETG